MKRTKKLQIQHLDQKIASVEAFPGRPTNGWINTIRTSLNISLKQLGAMMNIAPQSVMDMEVSEKGGKISLNSLEKVASALNMKLVYGFLPTDGSFEKMIEKQALITAHKIVMRTNATMKLENQQVSKARLEKAIKELASEIKDEMPRYLWD